MTKIFVTRRIPEDGIARLTTNCIVDVWPEASPPDRSTLLQRVAGCSGILSMLSDRIDAEVLDAAGPQLRGVANYAVGYNNIDLSAAAARGVSVGNTPDALTDATADVAIGLLLAAARSFRSAISNVDRLEWKNWEPLRFLGQELAGKTLGIVGMGRIGSTVARRLHFGWGMPVLYTSRSIRSDAENSLGARRVSLEELLRHSDFITLHTSLQPETRGMIGKQQLAWMKSSSVLVNTSRGEVVDQNALYEALVNHQIFAAGLDVTDPEPLPGNSPLRGLDNCVILPHIGSATFEARRKMAIMAAENLLAATQGNAMPYAVAVS